MYKNSLRLSAYIEHADLIDAFKSAPLYDTLEYHMDIEKYLSFDHFYKLIASRRPEVKIQFDTKQLRFARNFGNQCIEINNHFIEYEPYHPNISAAKTYVEKLQKESPHCKLNYMLIPYEAEYDRYIPLYWYEETVRGSAKDIHFICLVEEPNNTYCMQSIRFNAIKPLLHLNYVQSDFDKFALQSYVDKENADLRK